MKINFRNQEIELTRGSSENKMANLQKIPLVGKRNTLCINLNIDDHETTFLIDIGYNMFATINANAAELPQKKELVQW